MKCLYPRKLPKTYTNTYIHMYKIAKRKSEGEHSEHLKFT